MSKQQFAVEYSITGTYMVDASSPEEAEGIFFYLEPVDIVGEDSTVDIDSVYEVEGLLSTR